MRGQHRVADMSERGREAGKHQTGSTCSAEKDRMPARASATSNSDRGG